MLLLLRLSCQKLMRKRRDGSVKNAKLTLAVDLSWRTDLSDAGQKKKREGKHMQCHNSRAREQQY
jgi:hypothetical protein